MIERFDEVFGAEWSVAAKQVSEIYDRLWGDRPHEPAFDLTGADIPDIIIEEIRKKNIPRVTGKLSSRELSASDSPFRLGTYIDDQLVEIIDAIDQKYTTQDFINQMCFLVRTFYNESAALRASTVEERISCEDANEVIALIRNHFHESSDEIARYLLQLMATDLADGGSVEWMACLSEENRNFCNDAFARFL